MYKNEQEIAKYSVKLNKKAAKRDSFSSPRTRIIFTKEDDKKLVDFVNNHGEFTPSGSKLWQLAEEKLDGGHTWQSMRSRYLKVVRKLNFNSDGEGEEEFNGDHVDEDKDDRDHSQSKNKRKNDRHDDNNHVKKKSKKDETDEGESSDDLNETSNKKAKLQAEESFIEADYLDHIQNDDDDNEEEDGDVDDILTQEISKPRTNIHSKKSDNKNNNKKNYDDDENDNNNDNDDNESDENVKDKSYVKEIVLSVINNLMLTTKLPKSVVVHGLIVNNGVVSDTIQYLNNPQGLSLLLLLFLLLFAYLSSINYFSSLLLLYFNHCYLFLLLIIIINYYYYYYYYYYSFIEYFSIYLLFK